MSRERVAMVDLQEMVRLHRMGSGFRKVAQLMKISPNTEREYRELLGQAGLLEGAVTELPDVEVLKRAVEALKPPKPATQEASSAEQWRESVAALWKLGVGPQAIWDRLRTEKPDEFKASLSAIKRLCLRLKRERGVRAEDVVIRVDTAAGEVAQVDFGYVGKLFDPGSQTYRKAWVFVLVLGHSRHMWADIVFDQSAMTWIRLHMDAFAALGGVPRTLVPDNLKAAVITAAFGADRDTLGLHRSYRELARHYGFRIDPAPPRAPKKKGKVEAMVRYLKHNFMAGREEQDVTVVRRDLRVWIEKIAGLRVHGSTGKRPLQVFEDEERAALLPLPATPYDVALWRAARVHPDSHIAVERVLYSVPFTQIGRQAWAKLTEKRVTIYVDDVRVADHPRRGHGRSTYDPHLPIERAELRHRSREFWETRASKMGNDVRDYIRDVFDSDDVVSQLRVVQAIVTHLETFPVERAQAACRRASEHGNHTYRGIKAILVKALDLEDVAATQPEHGRLTTARFARDPAAFRRFSHGGTA
jgi:transposase